MSQRILLSAILGWSSILSTVGPAVAQPVSARAVLEQAAAAMGGMARLQAVDNFVMTGFGTYLNQDGGGNLSSDPKAPSKRQAANAVVRSFDLRSGRALLEDRRGFMFPFAIERGHSWEVSSQLQSGISTLDHPLTALRAALDRRTRLGPIRTEADRIVVEFTVAGGETLWLGIDAATRLPSWVRWVAGSTTLGDVTYTAYFTGYLPFDGIQLPVGLTTDIDWRETRIAELHVDSYRLDTEDLPAFPAARAAGEPSDQSIAAEATPIAPGVWDVRYGGNGGAVIEFADHLTMFEAYANEAATFARLDLANSLVPGKQVTEVIVSHHHFDHSGGLRAAVSRGLTVISRRGNEGIFREMVARPAVNFPDALARNPQPLKFVPVDEHLVLDDGTMRVDVYHAIGHLHMADAVFAYIPAHRIFLEGDFTTYNWTWHWWGGAYMDNVEHYSLDPAINIPVHGIVTDFDQTIAAIEDQVQRARDFCSRNEAAGIFMAGCPVKYSRDSED